MEYEIRISAYDGKQDLVNIRSTSLSSIDDRISFGSIMMDVD